MSCPYATSLLTTSDDPETATHTTSTSSSIDSQNEQPISAAQALQLAKESCPAFSNACPFKHVSNGQDMRKALSSLPPSHISFVSKDGNSSSGSSSSTNSTIQHSLRVALEHVHSVSQARNEQDSSSLTRDGGETVPQQESKFDLGGCPFKTLVPTRSQTAVSFVSAMEEFSLAAIMAQMVHSKEEEEEEAADAKDTNKNVLTSTPITSSTPQPPTRTLHNRRSSSVSHALQTGTAESHSAAESVHFVQQFIQGNISQELYSHLIWNLYHVYQTLETNLEQFAPHVFPTLYFPTELNRTQALKEDVEFFWGSHDNVRHGISTATKEYQDRLNDIAKTEPLLLLAHAYTRYLGDLSGGKVLARVAKRALSLSGSRDGLAFYYFDAIPSAKVFKDDYRQCLDSLSLSEEQVERLVAEANVAFVLNMRLFEELDVRAGIPGAKVRPVEEATRFLDKCLEKQEERRRLGVVSKSVSLEEEVGVGEEEEVKCPFAALGGPNPHGTKNDASGGTARNTAASTKVKTFGGASNEKEGNVHSKGGRCPWPFVFFHDPQQGMRDYQTWVVIGLVSCWIWSKMSA